MTLSHRSLQTLLDLVEIKLSCLEITDREDMREAQILKRAKTELELLSGRAPADALPGMLEVKRRGRRPKRLDA